MERPTGMHPEAFAAYVTACFQAGISPARVVQTLGHAAASAGTHGKDGTFINENGKPEAYSAALDLSVKHPRLTVEQRERLQKKLWSNGFGFWYRQAPEFPNNEHLHGIYFGVKMKRSLRNQAHAFLAHTSGLVSDKADKFVRDNLTATQEQHLRKMFLENNPMTG